MGQKEEDPIMVLFAGRNGIPRHLPTSAGGAEDGCPSSRRRLMKTMKLKKISPCVLKILIPLADYYVLESKSLLFQNFSSSPFPKGNDKKDFVGLETAIRRCKRVGLYN